MRLELSRGCSYTEIRKDPVYKAMGSSMLLLETAINRLKYPPGLKYPVEKEPKNLPKKKRWFGWL